MRLFSYSSIAALVAVVQAVTPGGLYLHALHSQSTTKSQSAIDADIARYIIASRLGVDQYHTLGASSDRSLQAINHLGRQRALFGSEETPTALLLATADSDIRDALPHKVQIDSLPSSEDTETLVAALAVQAAGGEGITIKEAKAALRAGQDLTTSTSLIRISQKPAGLDSEILALESQGYDVLVLFAPSSTTKHKYGPYTIPTPLTKRSALFEEPLDATIDSLVHSIIDTLSNDTSASTAAQSSASPLRGILPFCYTSKSACESTTRNCTGHGSCTLAYTQRSSAGDDSSATPCYQCSCVASVRRNADGTTKTTEWGGPACQKKNVVTPFWLLAGFSVVMMFLVGWAVGLVWSMGDEQLPSVIGAGVSGVPPRK